MSEVIAKVIEDIVEAKAAAEPEDIELEGFGAKRIFKGHELYWREDGPNETGVFLTAKGKIAYWSFHAHADQEKFEVYEDLDELWEEQDWIKPQMRSAIQREYVTLTNKPIVERLDI